MLYGSSLPPVGVRSSAFIRRRVSLQLLQPLKHGRLQRDAMIGKTVVGLQGSMFERDGTLLLNCSGERFHNLRREGTVCFS